jgi:hypothetical protein
VKPAKPNADAKDVTALPAQSRSPGIIGPPPLPVPAIPIAAGPLTPEHLTQLAAAKASSKAIRRAVSVANFDGWGLAVFAALSLVCGFYSVSGWIVAVGMGFAAFVELRAAGRLSQLDPDAPRVLAINQLCMAGLLILYAGWNLFTTMHAPAGSGMFDSPELGSMGESMESLDRLIYTCLYGGLIFVAIVFQGGSALYHFRRKAMVRDYLAKTPPWVIEMQRAGVGFE